MYFMKGLCSQGRMWLGSVQRPSLLWLTPRRDCPSVCLLSADNDIRMKVNLSGYGIILARCYLQQESSIKFSTLKKHNSSTSYCEYHDLIPLVLLKCKCRIFDLVDPRLSISKLLNILGNPAHILNFILLRLGQCLLLVLLLSLVHSLVLHSSRIFKMSIYFCRGNILCGL